MKSLKVILSALAILGFSVAAMADCTGAGAADPQCVQKPDGQHASNYDNRSPASTTNSDDCNCFANPKNMDQTKKQAALNGQAAGAPAANPNGTDGAPGQ